MQSEDDRKNSDSLISKGIRPDVVANMSADRRQMLAERLRTKPVKDRTVFVWLTVCVGIIAVTALFSFVL